MIQLIAENPSFPPQVYKRSDLDGIRILGTAYYQDNPLIVANGGKTILQCVSGWEGMDKWDTVTKLDGRGYVERYVK